MIYSGGKFEDERGLLYTVYDDRVIPGKFVQDKVSHSKYGTIRGFHGDAKTTKLISCLYGEFLLVTYDLASRQRREYLMSHHEKNTRSILVPPNVLNAHQCLSDECILFYKWSEYYTRPEDQYSVYYGDEDINAKWIRTRETIVSDRDRTSGRLKELYESIAKNTP